MIRVDKENEQLYQANIPEFVSDGGDFPSFTISLATMHVISEKINVNHLFPIKSNFKNCQIRGMN